MHKRSFLFAALIAAATTMPVLAEDLNVAGVQLEPTINVAGSPLILNGAGIRYKAVFKVNVTAMYASKKFSSIDEFIAAPGPKRISITLLRELPSETMGVTLAHGIDDNTPRNELSKITPDLIRIGGIFNAFKVLQPNDRVLIDWIPGTGMVVNVKGQVQGEPYKEPAFFRSLVSIWLGPKPVDYKLKDALLAVK